MLTLHVGHAPGLHGRVFFYWYRAGSGVLPPAALDVGRAVAA